MRQNFIFSFLICFQFIEGIFLKKFFFEFYFCKISLPLRFQSDRGLCSGVSYPRLPVEPSGAPPSATHTPQITVQAIGIVAITHSAVEGHCSACTGDRLLETNSPTQGSRLLTACLAQSKANSTLSYFTLDLIDA